MKRDTLKIEILQKRSRGPILLTILLIGLFLKIKFVFQESLWPDEALYLYISRNLSSDILNLTNISGELFYESPPLFMYILSLIAGVQFIEFEQAARTAVALMGTGTLVCTYFIGKKVYTPLVGMVGALLLAVCPLSNWNGIRVLNDVPVVFFIYLSICMLVHDKKAAFYFFALCAVFIKYTAFPVLLLPYITRLRPRTWVSYYLIGFIAILFFVAGKSFFPDPGGRLSYFYQFFQLPDISQAIVEFQFFLGYFLSVVALVGMYFTIKEQKYSALFHWVCFFGLCRFFLPWIAFRVSRYTLPLYPGLYLLAAYGSYRITVAMVSKWPTYSRWIKLFVVVSITGLAVRHSQESVTLLTATSNTFIGYEQAGSFLMNQPRTPRSLATASPRQMKYFAPDFDIHDIEFHFTPEDLRMLVDEKQIQYLSIDSWSPHLPAWCRNYDYPNNGYTLIHGENNVYVFAVNAGLRK